MALNKTQQMVADLYCGGDMTHIKSVEEAEDCGDTLFLFLLREAEDAETSSVFFGMLGTAKDQMDNLLVAMQEQELSIGEEKEMLAAAGFEIKADQSGKFYGFHRDTDTRSTGYAGTRELAVAECFDLVACRVMLNQGLSDADWNALDFQQQMEGVREVYVYGADGEALIAAAGVEIGPDVDQPGKYCWWHSDSSTGSFVSYDTREEVLDKCVCQIVAEVKGKNNLSGTDWHALGVKEKIAMVNELYRYPDPNISNDQTQSPAPQ